MGDMILTVLDPNRTDHWMEVHLAGCADLGRRDRHGIVRSLGAWDLEVPDRRAAADEIASDFIGESMTVDEAVMAIHFAPCVPEDAP